MELVDGCGEFDSLRGAEVIAPANELFAESDHWPEEIARLPALLMRLSSEDVRHAVSWSSDCLRACGVAVRGIFWPARARANADDALDEHTASTDDRIERADNLSDCVSFYISFISLDRAHRVGAAGLAAI